MPKGCVIFDFDGVIADTEALHLAAYNQMFAAHAAAVGSVIRIAPVSYFTRYIVYGDREAISHMLRDHGVSPADALLDTLAAAKEQLFQERLHTFAEPLPGVRQVLAWLEQHHVPRAICSGARRHEILMLLEAFGLRQHFDVVVAIEDVNRGKPDPEGYNKAFALLNAANGGRLEKRLSLVIEDSAGGCSAGKAAGMRVLGVATSLPLEEVACHATFAVSNLMQAEGGRLSDWLGVGEG